MTPGFTERVDRSGGERLLFASQPARRRSPFLRGEAEPGLLFLQNVQSILLLGDPPPHDQRMLFQRGPDQRDGDGEHERYNKPRRHSALPVP